MERQLKLRDAGVLRAWPDDPDVRAMAHEMAKVIKGWMELPNDCYLPDDRLELLLFDGYISSRSLGIESELRKQLGLPKNFDFSALADIVTYGELVDRILKAPGRQPR